MSGTVACEHSDLLALGNDRFDAEFIELFHTSERIWLCITGTCQCQRSISEDLRPDGRPLQCRRR